MRMSAKFGLLFCCLPALMGAGVYRWVDENGVVNFTQQKPEHVAAERIAPDSGTTLEDAAATDAPTAPPTAPSQPSGSDQLTDAQRQALAELNAAESARAAAVSDIRAANCERARGVLERLTATGRVRVRDENGTVQAMGEDERQQRMADARTGIVENCAGGASG